MRNDSGFLPLLSVVVSLGGLQEWEKACGGDSGNIRITKLLDAARGSRTLWRMDDQSRDEGGAGLPTPAVEDFPAGQGRGDGRGRQLAPLAAALTMLSAVALAFAFVSAAGIILLDALHWLRPELTWKVKSALPLIGIGVSYASLQFTLRRSWIELCLSLVVSLAFILWGAEQFIAAPRIASTVDDFVVFLFVLDLGIVIRGRLKASLGRSRSGSKA